MVKLNEKSYKFDFLSAKYEFNGQNYPRNIFFVLNSSFFKIHEKKFWWKNFEIFFGDLGVMTPPPGGVSERPSREVSERTKKDLLLIFQAANFFVQKTRKTCLIVSVAII